MSSAVLIFTYPVGDADCAAGDVLSGADEGESSLCLRPRRPGLASRRLLRAGDPVDDAGDEVCHLANNPALDLLNALRIARKVARL
jgi:hypothetical protein